MPINQETDLILGEILEIEGVNGAIVSDWDGSVIAARMPPIYDFDSVSQVTKKIVSTIININFLEKSSELASYHYSDDMRILIRSLNAGFLILMSISTVNVIMLNIATNHSCKKINALLDATSSNKHFDSIEDSPDSGKKILTANATNH